MKITEFSSFEAGQASLTLLFLIHHSDNPSISSHLILISQFRLPSRLLGRLFST